MSHKWFKQYAIILFGNIYYFFIAGYNPNTNAMVMLGTSSEIEHAQ